MNGRAFTGRRSVRRRVLDAGARPAAIAAVLGIAIALTGGCGPADAPTVTVAADDPGAYAQVARRAEDHLLAHGARRARRQHPDGYWFRGSLVMPGGGPTCAIASVTAGAHGPLVTDVLFDPSGMVSVRIRADERDRDRCLARVERALSTFVARPASGRGRTGG